MGNVIFTEEKLLAIEDIQDYSSRELRCYKIKYEKAREIIEKQYENPSTYPIYSYPHHIFISLNNLLDNIENELNNRHVVT